MWGDFYGFSLEENAETLLFSVTVHFPKLAFGAFSPRKSMKVGQQLTELVALGTSFDPGRRGFDPRLPLLDLKL
jgi:hypothetical protein